MKCLMARPWRPHSDGGPWALAVLPPLRKPVCSARPAPRKWGLALDQRGPPACPGLGAGSGVGSAGLWEGPPCSQVSSSCPHPPIRMASSGRWGLEIDECLLNVLSNTDLRICKCQSIHWVSQAPAQCEPGRCHRRAHGASLGTPGTPPALQLLCSFLRSLRAVGMRYHVTAKRAVQ